MTDALESAGAYEPVALVWFTLTRFGPCVGFPWLSLSTSEGEVFSLLFSVPLSASSALRVPWSWSLGVRGSLFLLCGQGTEGFLLLSADFASCSF
jgi:hypothetical protein